MKKIIKRTNQDGSIKVGLYAKKVDSETYKIYLKIRKNHRNDLVEYDIISKPMYEKFLNDSETMLYGIVNRFVPRIGCNHTTDFFEIKSKKKK